MKLPFNSRLFTPTLIILLITIFSHVYTHASQLEKLQQKNINVRVLLDACSTENSGALNILSDNAILLSGKSGMPIIRKKYLNKLEIKFRKNNIYLNNKKTDLKIFKLSAEQGHLKFNDKEFQGSFFMIHQNNMLFLINNVSLEDYTFSVLLTESWPGWPLELNKAFAIASRTYVISKYLDSKNQKPLYHVKNTNTHQTYHGVKPESKYALVLKKAVEETEGIVVCHKKKPILAMFDSCCGGIIPAHIKDFDFEKAPYLKRKAQCTFCKTCKLYTWHAEYNKYIFEKILQKELIPLKNLTNITVLKKDKAEIVQKIEVRDKKNKYILTGKKLYSLCDKVKSFSFSIVKKGDIIKINGRGYGHHMGICQWGARQMVNQNWDYASILKFYYPGTNLMKLHKNNNSK